MTATVASTKEPIYPIAYAAKLAGLNATTARRWMRGYPYTHNGERRQSAPVVRSTISDADARNNLTFEELLTLRLVRAFREKGLGLLTIKKAAQAASLKYGMENPFVTKSFRSDGRSVFLELQQKGGLKEQEVVLVHALTGQQQFRSVVEPSLFRDVVFVGETPSQWFPQGRDHAVVIRPDRAFGAPHVVGTGVRTDVITDAVTAENGNVEAVASWFGITQDQVNDAVAIEAEWRNQKAA